MLNDTSASTDTAPEEAYRMVRASRIRPNPDQPRRTFITREVTELSESLKDRGQDTPIKITSWPGDPERPFMIIDGEKRWRGCNSINENFLMKCLIEVVTDPFELYRRSLRANQHRSEPPANDVAQSVVKLKQGGLTILEIAREFGGKSVTWVQNYLMLDTLDDEVKALLDPNLPENKRLGVSAAFEIARVPIKQLQRDIALEILAQNMNLTEARVHIGEVVRRKQLDIPRGRATSGARDMHKNLKTFLERTNNRLRGLMNLDWGVLLSYKDDPDEIKYEAIAALRRIENHAKNVREMLERDY